MSRPIRSLLNAALLVLAVACSSSPGPSPGDSTSPGEDTAAPGETVVAPDATAPDDLAVPLPDAVVGEDLEPDEETSVPPDAELPPDVALPSPALVINEVVTKDPEGGPDWFELTVVGNEAVNLADYAVVDGDPDHLPQNLPKVSLMPGQFYVLQAIDADEWSPDPFVPFKLGGVDALTLRRAGEIVDRVDWRGQPPAAGTSLGRLGDGAGPWGLRQPTPGAANKDLLVKLNTCADPFFWDRAIPVELAVDEASWAAMKANPAAEEYHPGNFLFMGTKVDNVAIRIKGGKGGLEAVTQSGTDRYSFKVDFNEYVDKQKFCGVKKLVFNNGLRDPTMLREHLAYRVARQMGLPAPRTAFVDLTVAGHHLGLYLMVEPVDDDFFLEEHFDNDNGDLYQADQPDGTLQYQGPSFFDYQGIDVENNQETTTHAAFLAFIKTINQGPGAPLDTVLDVKAALRYLAWSAALLNLDGYLGTGRNFYLYEQDGIFTVIPWDVEESFGTHDCGCETPALLDFFVDEPTCGPLSGRPLAATLLGDPARLDKYHQYLGELLAIPLAPKTLAAWTELPAGLVRTSLEAGDPGFYSVNEFETALVEQVGPVGPTSVTVFGIAPFVKERGASIAAQLEGKKDSANGGKGNCGNP